MCAISPIEFSRPARTAANCSHWVFIAATLPLLLGRISSPENNTKLSHTEVIGLLDWTIMIYRIMIQTFKVSIFSLKVQREVSSCLYQSAVLCFTGPCVVYSSLCSHYYGAGQNVGQSINTILIPWRQESTFRTIVKHLSGMEVSKNKRERERERVV